MVTRCGGDTEHKQRAPQLYPELVITDLLYGLMMAWPSWW